MAARAQALIQTAVAVLLVFSCDRERSNPLDPQSDVRLDRPPTPSGLTAEGGVGAVRLAWQAVEAGDLAGYAVYRAASSNGEFVFVPGEADAAAGITTGKTSFVDSVEAVERTFYYRVAAVDTSGLASLMSGFVGATVAVDRVPPEPPQNLSAVTDPARADRVVVRWTAPRRDADGGQLSGLAGYVVFRAEVGRGSLVPLDTLASGAAEHADGGLRALTAYTYAVMAFDGAGNQSQLSEPQQVTTRGLATPTDLEAQSQIGRIEVSWQAQAAVELLGFNVFRSTRSDTGYSRLAGREGSTFTTGLTSYTDSSVAAGALHYYRVQAVGRDGLVSEVSGFVGARVLADEVPPGVPQNVSAVADEEDFGRVVVRWSAPARDADGGELSGL
ncbi:MAG: hypothetical protein AB1505_21260, partial [Candidatus Latescibacterota bacterium]